MAHIWSGRHIGSQRDVPRRRGERRRAGRQLGSRAAVRRVSAARSRGPGQPRVWLRWTGQCLGLQRLWHELLCPFALRLLRRHRALPRRRLHDAASRATVAFALAAAAVAAAVAAASPAATSVPRRAVLVGGRGAARLAQCFDSGAHRHAAVRRQLAVHLHRCNEWSAPARRAILRLVTGALRRIAGQPPLCAHALHCGRDVRGHAG